MKNISNVPQSTIPRDVRELDKETVNIYESLVIISKRANQFAHDSDNLEEVFENREQIEISTYYEKLPKPTLIAVQEFLDSKVYHRNPSKKK